MLCADLRSMDPVSYITAIGLDPEDSYGFLPVEQSDGSALVYIYRDRARYAEVRAGLRAPQRSQVLGGLIEVDRPQDVEINLGGVAPADMSVAIADALALAESLGASSVPQAAEPARASSSAAPIASHRVYPGLHTRSSLRQLNHFLPRYAEQVGIHAEDVFGIFPRGMHYFGGGSTREWQSMWLVYRDRPEYAQGRELWAAVMAKGGGWPAAEISPGSETRPEPASGPARVEVSRIGWPKRKLVARETAENVGPRLIEEIDEFGYGPEHAIGMCPDFDNRKIYFAWTTS
jgi:hypothetical protein